MTWVSISGLIYFICLCIFAFVFNSSLDIVNMIQKEWFKLFGFLLLPLIALLVVRSISFFRNRRMLPKDQNYSIITHSIGCFVLLAANIIFFFNTNPNQNTETVPFVFLFISLFYIGILFKIVNIIDQIKARDIVISVFIVVIIWSISFLWNNDGVRYNDPPYIAIPALFVLFPAIICFVIAIKCKHSKQLWSYILYGLGLVIFYASIIIYMSTSGGRSDTSCHIAIGFAVMLLMFLVGFDIQNIDKPHVNHSFYG